MTGGQDQDQDQGQDPTVALGRYDRTAAVIDGRVALRGHRPRFVTPPAEEMFANAFDGGAYDASELSFSNFLRHSVAGTCRYVGLPVFPSRSFRHGTLYVLRDGPVREPADLDGARIGVREYSMTAALAARGALRDSFGLEPARMRWIVGDVDAPERDVVPLPTLHRDISVAAAPKGRVLVDMLRAREIDALLAYKPPKAFGDGSGPIRRLFDDVASAEQDYFRQTGLFPVMHLVGLRRDHAEADPGLGLALYEALAEAGRLALAGLRQVDALPVSLPWLAQERDRTAALMGEDWWPSGLAANRAVLSRMIGWSFEDGLIPEKPDPEDLMLPILRGT